MSYIDRPKGKELSLLVAHPSEKGWNLPRTHKRHFMKFPSGMLYLKIMIAKIFSDRLLQRLRTSFSNGP